MRSEGESYFQRSVVIDASGLVLGRMASNIAKRVLYGQQVVVVNAEKAVISGHKRNLVERALQRLQLRTLGSQSKAPKRPRTPDGFVRRTVRGMLPWKKPKGKKAYRKLRVHVGVPEGTTGVIQTIPEARRELYNFLTVGELLKTFGWKHPLER